MSEDAAEDDSGPRCRVCLVRPPRPGSPYCSAFCRVLSAARRLGLLLAALATLAACTGTSSTTARATRTARPPATSAPPTAKAAPARCAWYTVTTDGGQQVIVTATRTPCGSPPLLGWIARKTGRTWITTRYVTGTCIAQLARAGVVVQIWVTGWARRTQEAAGYLADDMADAGWQTQQAPGGGPTPPPLPTPIGSAA